MGLAILSDWRSEESLSWTCRGSFCVNAATLLVVVPLSKRRADETWNAESFIQSPAWDFVSMCPTFKR